MTLIEKEKPQIADQKYVNKQLLDQYVSTTTYENPSRRNCEEMRGMARRESGWTRKKGERGERNRN